MSNHIVKRTSKAQTVNITKDDLLIILSIIDNTSLQVNINQMATIVQLRQRLQALTESI